MSFRLADDGILTLHVPDTMMIIFHFKFEQDENLDLSIKCHLSNDSANLRSQYLC